MDKIEKRPDRQTEAEAVSRISRLPPGTLTTQPVPVLTRLPKSP
jgi:hypothetical protein